MCVWGGATQHDTTNSNTTQHDAASNSTTQHDAVMRDEK